MIDHAEPSLPLYRSQNIGFRTFKQVMTLASFRPVFLSDTVVKMGRGEIDLYSDSVLREGLLDFFRGVEVLDNLEFSTIIEFAIGNLHSGRIESMVNRRAHRLPLLIDEKHRSIGL